jgi:ABC-type branched-subunit amino acid transport system substrate-binding protein
LPAGSGTGGTTGAGATSGIRGPIKTGVGVTATSIKVGFQLIDAGTAAQSTGTKGGTGTVSPAQLVNAVVNYVNNHGGITGRKIDAITNIYNAETDNYTTAAQAGCTKFTEDNHVFAGITTADSLPDVFISCLAAHSTPAIVYGDTAYDDTDYRQWPDFYTLANVDASRWGFYIDDLVADGFLSKAHRIGLIESDMPRVQRMITEVLKPRLAAHGLTVAAEATVRHIDSISGLSNTSADDSSAVLRFRSANIDRALFVDTQGGGPYFFLQEAEQQGYRPLYGFTSLEKMVQMTANAPAAQLHGGQAVGWWPVLDVEAPQDPGGRPQYTFCRSLFRAAGISNFAGRYAERDAMGVCDGVYFLKTALERASELTPPGLRNAVEAMGGAFAPAATFATRYGPGDHWGVHTVRDLAFDDACGCWKYVGAAHNV